ncbi:MAG: CPBP family intramembrane metalloprotease [Ktedonobacteraceae bacterium]|nr:CPBP family intramembrane metalloprotease [Ktedonobacteraceae bacterium]
MIDKSVNIIRDEAIASDPLIHYGPNDIEILKIKVSEKHITWTWPLILCFIRFPLLLVGFVIALTYYTMIGNSHAFNNALSMSNFYTTLTADLGCLVLLAWLTRREGIRLRDLFASPRGKRGAREVLLNIGLCIPIFIVFYITFILASGLSSLVVYGPSAFQQMQQSSTFDPLSQGLPLWLFWWATLILPLGVGFLEEMTYRAYAQRRLQALSGKAWVAIFVMSLGFGMQHIAYSMTSWQDALSRFLAMFLSGLVIGCLYQLTKRLVPLIFAHWLLDFLALGLFPLLSVLALYH